MNFYERLIEPRLIDVMCGRKAIKSYREALVPMASGCVLELGAGSGLNFAYYDSGRVEFLWALEPNERMRARADKRLPEATVTPHWLEAYAEEIPLPSASVDSVLTTFTLCSVNDLSGALDEVRRVLKPGGRLLFCEHGAAPDTTVNRWQQRLNGIGRCMLGGCDITRDHVQAIEAASLSLVSLRTEYTPGVPKFRGFTSLGVATVS